MDKDLKLPDIEELEEELDRANQAWLESWSEKLKLEDAPPQVKPFLEDLCQILLSAGGRHMLTIVVQRVLPVISEVLEKIGDELPGEIETETEERIKCFFNKSHNDQVNLFKK
jgi:hypothetical protein